MSKPTKNDFIAQLFCEIQSRDFDTLEKAFDETLRKTGGTPPWHEKAGDSNLKERKDVTLGECLEWLAENVLSFEHGRDRGPWLEVEVLEDLLNCFGVNQDNDHEPYYIRAVAWAREQDPSLPPLWFEELPADATLLQVHEALKTRSVGMVAMLGYVHQPTVRIVRDGSFEPDEFLPTLVDHANAALRGIGTLNATCTNFAEETTPQETTT